MSSITFKLKSSSHIGTIDFEGRVITCREVQEKIAAKLSAPPEEIRVFLAGDSALLHPDEHISAYTVVDVVRQVATGRPAPRPRGGGPPPGFPGQGTSPGAATNAGGAAPNKPGDRPLSEEERLAQLQADVSLDTGIDEVSNRFFSRGRGRGFGRGGEGIGRGGRGAPGGLWGMGSVDESFRPPSRTYVCHNCGKHGHFIEHCPAAKAGNRQKELARPIGIPESMLVECTMDDPAPKFITRDGRLVKRRLDASAFESIALVSSSNNDAEMEQNAGAREEAESEMTVSSAELKEYECIVDHVVASEAMKMPCCGKLMCKRCFSKLVDEALGKDCFAGDDDEPVVCPACEEPLIMDDVVPAVDEREQIQAFLQSRKRPRS